MKKLGLSILIAFGINSSAWSTDIYGGQLGGKFVGQNEYQVTLKLYRDCNSTTPFTPVVVEIYQLGTNVFAGKNKLYPSVNFNIPITDSCNNPLSVCMDEGIYVSDTINLPDYGPGYYAMVAVYSRSGQIQNLDVPISQGATFYAEIPDPSLGSNSSPLYTSFIDGPYFCVGYDTQFSFDFFDPDGDSLSYHLENPLFSSSNFPSPGPYSPVIWNTVDGCDNNLMLCTGSAISIDPLTGIISAMTNNLGMYSFAIRVDEYRAGIKIGETRMDIAFQSINCIQCSVGLNEATIEDNKAYPNPTSGFITIEFPNTVTEIDLQIINALGQQLERFTIPSGQETIELNLGRYETGYYTVITSQDNNIQVMRLVKY